MGPESGAPPAGGITYKDAGVDIDAGERAVQMMKALVRATFTPAVLADLGSFGAMFQPDLSGIGIPVLVSTADGVGTKLKVAFMTGRHITVGQDLVNHCTNDLLVQGARALFFLDYFATGRLSPEIAAQVVEGLSIACKEQGCALIGGETAEMPDMYKPGEYDLAGFMVGIVDRNKIVTGAAIRPGDKVIGLASNGLNTNGYSLARKLIFEVAGWSPDYVLPHGKTVADELLRIHPCYAPAVRLLLDMAENPIIGMAHITGGGLPGNLVRILPEGCRAIVDPSPMSQPIFSYLQQIGSVPQDDMNRTFNRGVGFTLVVRPEDVSLVLARLPIQEGMAPPQVIGEIIADERGVDVIN